jgi:hypothetical protein
LGLATDDLIQGKPFRAEPNTVYWFHRGLTRPEPCLALTDARTPQTPTEDVFIEGAPEIALTWELGQALPPGQRLKTIRLTWSLEDPFRNGIRVRFEVRDAATQTWRAATDYLAVPPVAPVDNGYQAMEVDCAGKDIAGFDAFRMVDGLGKYNPRYVELDAIAGPRDSQ